ncbi:MAG: phosphoribosylformylglycinamidine synthase subunit PurS [Deltaproteobacteria bacterium]|nr:phosphoribosylformylglycinamidine synthase subunit PurS [Deltaproteobacteria bacterium]
MAHRIEVALKAGLRDPAGEKVKRRAAEDFGIAGISSVRVVDAYNIDGELESDELDLVAREPFSDRVVQAYAVDRPVIGDFDCAIEVGFLPGVTDNVGRTATEALEVCVPRAAGKCQVYTSRVHLFRGTLSPGEAERIGEGMLANLLIQSCRITDRASFAGRGRFEPQIPKVRSRVEPRVETIDLEVPDEGLNAISRDRVLVLSLREMCAIQAHYRDARVREARLSAGLGVSPTDVELEVLAQTWSEHCKHKIFNARVRYRDAESGAEETVDGLFATYVKRTTAEVRRAAGARDICVSVFSDNAGVIRFDETHNLVFKVETHNSPSALDPYGGALTGIVGVNRDPFGTGLGSKLIFNTDVFCFASPFRAGALPPRILHPRRIFEGVREGVEHGGNKSGIPTVNGSVVFDESYLGKPLVFCGTAGIIPRELNGRPSESKEVVPGDLIVMTGGRIGKDGIHGATFSSEELHEGSPVTAVQIGDPITQKRMTDFLLAARDAGLYRAITDNGAGGLSSSVGEMARLSGGCEIDLTDAPLKYAGLHPWEILISEAQERMTLAVAPEKTGAFSELAARMKVEATVMGRFTQSGRFVVRYRGKTVALLDMDFLHEGLPRMELEAVWRPPRPAPDEPACPADLGPALRDILGRLNVCSKHYIVRQYDHEVQGGSVVKPLTGAGDDGPSDAAVIRPVLGSHRGVVVAHGIVPRYSAIDTYSMVSCGIDEAMRNYVSVGGDPGHAAGLDNFCWCDPVKSAKNPEGDFNLARLVRANKALFDCCTALGVPLISGKDSMKNDYIHGDTKISILPTVLFSVIGVIPDARKAVTMDVKAPGDLVYVVGMTRSEMGASEYWCARGVPGGTPPAVDPSSARRVFAALHGAVLQGLVASCHDSSDGGLGVALAEAAFAGGLGIAADLWKAPHSGVERDDHLLFSESATRFVVTVKSGKKRAFEAAMDGVILGLVGEVTASPRLQLRGAKGGRPIVDEDVFDLKKAWQKTLDF